MAKPENHIVEAEITGSFDNLSHEKFIELIRITPQSSTLCPMLVNVFPHHVLEAWFETTVISPVRGFCELVRDTDHFIRKVLYAEDAERVVLRRIFLNMMKNAREPSDSGGKVFVLVKVEGGRVKIGIHNPAGFNNSIYGNSKLFF
jgi:signal transduction histidine kinase